MLGANFKPWPAVAVHDFFQEKESEAENLLMLRETISGSDALKAELLGQAA
jgi:hypothetical protein